MRRFYVFIAGLLAITAAACTSSAQEPDEPIYQSSSDAPPFEAPTEESDIFFYDPQPPECSVEGTIVENGTTSTLGEDVIGYGEVTARMSGGVLTKTDYAFMLYSNNASATQWLMVKLTYAEDSNPSSQVHGEWFLAAYPEADEELWTESYEDDVDFDGVSGGVGGTLRATFSRKDDPHSSAGLTSVDLAFICKDDDPPIEM